MTAEISICDTWQRAKEGFSMRGVFYSLQGFWLSRDPDDRRTRPAQPTSSETESRCHQRPMWLKSTGTAKNLDFIRVRNSNPQAS
jgi:hypothetical protein